VATHASSLFAARNRRVLLVVALAAMLAAAALVGVTLLQTHGEHTSLPGQPGRPPLQLELGLRTGTEARALRRAETLLDQDGEATQAAAIFRRYHTLEAQLGLAFATWRGPSSLGAVQKIAATRPNDPAALVNLGWAQYWAGARAQAVATWQTAASDYGNSPYGVDAEDALNPGVAPGLPPIIVVMGAAPPQARADLAAGIRLWDLKQVVSARRKLDAAVKLAPHAAETLVAAAVARFSPARPLAPFPHLGPLTAEFPRDPIVRLHLGLLLLWTRQVEKGKAQLRLAAAEEPASASAYARQARLLLKALEKHGP
jgi:tetratricopeptide (TPR) repeat protein